MTPLPMADHFAIAAVRAGPSAHSAVISASVVGNAMPAQTPPSTRATMSTVSLQAKEASSAAGMDSPVPTSSSSLRP